MTNGGTASKQSRDLAIDCQGVGLSPGTGIDILDDITLSVQEGEFVAIVGPSGCGKTTFLNAVAGLSTHTRGTLVVRGRAPAAGRRDTSYALARDTLLPWRTAVENVELPLLLRGVGKSERRKLAEDALSSVGLTSALDRHPAALSQGMRQRVALARAFVTKPTLMMMDEPFGALDAQTRMLMQDLLLSLLEEFGGTLLFITHDLAEALVLADRVVLFSNRPARVKAEYVVDIPRPRSSEDVRHDSRFVDLHDEMWRALKDELEP
ncbi:MAG: ABC transporter ATP-binding protein [Candidatus Dormibacteraceae bacterium]